MDKLEYLEQHHHITESLIGLVSIQTDMEGVSKVLAQWKPKLKEIQKQRYITLCDGMSEEELQGVLAFTGLNK